MNDPLLVARIELLEGRSDGMLSRVAYLEDRVAYLEDNLNRLIQQVLRLSEATHDYVQKAHPWF